MVEFDFNNLINFDFELDFPIEINFNSSFK
jgi:hypothetical protein